MNALSAPLKEISGLDEVPGLLKKGKAQIRITGCLDSQKVHLAAGISPEKSSVVVICENELKATAVFEDWQLYDKEVLLYPPRDMIFYQTAVAGNPIERARMKAIRAVYEQKKVTVITCTGGCMELLLPFDMLKNSVIELNTGGEINTDELSVRLVKLGYSRAFQVEMPGQFAIRGGIIDLYDMTMDAPWRIELWGDEIDSIRSFDPESQRSIENLSSIEIYPASFDAGYEEKGLYEKLTASFMDYFTADTVFFLDEPDRIYENAEAVFKEYSDAMKGRLESGSIEPYEANRMISPDKLFARLSDRNLIALSLLGNMGSKGLKFKKDINIYARSVSSYNNQFPVLLKDLKSWKKSGYRVILLCASKTRGNRLAESLMDEGLSAFFTQKNDSALNPGQVMVLYGNALKGFEYPLQKFVVVTESDMFGQKRRKKSHVKRYDGKNISGFSELSVGDYVVHEYHGLGIYKGIEKIQRDGIIKDYIKIEYAKGDSLFVQASQIGTLQKYGSSESHSSLKLNSLGSNEWKNTKSRVRKAVRDIASQLVKLYSQRQNSEGFSFGEDTIWQKEFEEMFPFEETKDQLDAIEDTKKDMESPAIMDRLICGDVGYGKTEIAIRAAFKAVQDSKQVIVLVPTTILAQQHYYTFMQRMKDYPVRIDLMCRFRTPAQQKKTIADLKKGLVDIVIGTHRLLSKDIEYKDPGLLIVDEEQRFGVAHKEKIKQLKSRIDVLTLTATPIPRTLHMGLIGIRDMSILEEPPMDRLPIQTYVMEYDTEIIREAISRELNRNGQVFYVYNRVAGIAEMAARIQDMFPEASVAFAHGQMKERQLEQIMYSFMNNEVDILVSTTIIETGMDISNVNTMIIHDADKFGLSQLYQLRGRIGRSNRTAYAFLMYRPNKMLKEEAEKRLHAIREFTDLGSGIKIAMRDLEIRGAGNLLGAEQSGHMEDVGYDLYCKMLTEAVNEAKGIEEKPDFETSIDIVADAFIPERYISNERQRLEIYKRIAAIESEEDKEEILDELIDRFTEPPKSVQNLLLIAQLKAMAHRLYFTEIKQMGNQLKLVFFEEARIKTENIPRAMEEFGGRLKFYMKDAPHFEYSMPKVRDMKLSAIEELIHLFEVLNRELLQV